MLLERMYYVHFHLSKKNASRRFVSNILNLFKLWFEVKRI